MHIPVVCPKCQKSYKIDPKMAGKQFRCSDCQMVLTVPRVVPAAQAIAPPAMPPARPKAPAPVQAAPRPRRVALARPPTEPGYDARGFRLNLPYEGGFLGAMDTFFNIAGQAGFWLVLLIFLILTADSFRDIYNLATTLRALPIAIIITRGAVFPVLFAFWALVHITLCVYAAAIAGNMFKFDLPEEPRWRTIGAQIGAGFYLAIGWMIMLLVGIISTGSPPAGLSSANAAVPAIVLFTLPLAIPTHFFLTWLLLRVKFVEALVAWLLQGVATLLSIGALGLIWWLVFDILPRLLNTRIVM
ncbi:MAG TPA: hypothetical protein VHM90_16690 [Phycisphaerae bacterium]|jgi:hypothetical protein|nr:hypothetical protein [Phycisphaerae bacterium]